jgi:hypothetical protein
MKRATSVKYVTSSFLFYTGRIAGLHEARKYDVPITKQGFTVTRLERERRSTPVQQFNDPYFIFDRHASTLPANAPRLVLLSDGGRDHSPRAPEVQFCVALDQLRFDRDFSWVGTRATGQQLLTAMLKMQSFLWQATQVLMGVTTTALSSVHNCAKA